MEKRIVFMGSPEFAVPVLQQLAEAYPVAGVVTQPDRPAGRGRSLTPPPVKVLALEIGLPVIQPARLRQPEAMQQLKAWAPDLIIVAAFGQILKQEVLDLPAFGCINVHASLLPRWRGAAPIQAAILHGDEKTGVSIMRMDAGIDTGDVLSQQNLEILPTDTAASLGERLSALGARLLLQTLPAYLDGSLAAIPQDSAYATYAPMLRKEDGLLDFTQPAQSLERRIRALNPWPGAYTFWQEQILKIHQARIASNNHPHLEPGRRMIIEGLPAYSTAQGSLVIIKLQPAGKRMMDGKTFLMGVRNWAQS